MCAQTLANSSWERSRSLFAGFWRALRVLQFLRFWWLGAPRVPPSCPPRPLPVCLSPPFGPGAPARGCSSSRLVRFVFALRWVRRCPCGFLCCVFAARRGRSPRLPARPGRLPRGARSALVAGPSPAAAGRPLSVWVRYPSAVFCPGSPRPECRAPSAPSSLVHHLTDCLSGLGSFLAGFLPLHC